MADDSRVKDTANAPPPRQDHSQDMSKSSSPPKPSGDSPKPHGDPLRDTIKTDKT